ncbi:MAG: DUF1592 domain-containing protein [Pirellulaceae bacterium]
MKHLLHLIVAAIALAECLLPSLAWAADGETVSRESIQSLLKTYCYRCHGAQKQKGDIRLDQLDFDLVKGKSTETWHDTLNKLNRGEMPPEDEPQLSVEQRRQLVGWLTEQLRLAARARKGSVGQVVMRRLNRAEYQYTMSDLLGVKLDYSEELPADARSADGFRNNGTSLETSALQIENYLKVARKAMDFVLVEGDQQERSVTRIERSKGKVKGPGSRRFMGNSSERLGRVNFWHGSFKDLPRTDVFTIRIKAHTDRKPGQPAPVLFARYGYFVSGLTLNIMGDAGEIAITSTTPEYYEIPGRPEFFPLPEAHVPTEKLNGVITLQNALIDGKPPTKPVSKVIEEKKNGKTRKRKVQEYPEDPDFPRIIIDSVEIVRHDHACWPPASHRNIVPGEEDLQSRASVRRVLKQFLRRAWRRPVSAAELEQWTAHFMGIRQEEETEIFALKETLAAALASANFVFLSEPHLASKTRPLSDHELATRLSYFLWSSLPDEELSSLADAGRLLEPSELRKQIDRMFADEKSDRFAEQFCMQWLDLEGVDRVAINPQYYKKFDNQLKPAMVGETLAFFKEILHSNSSALQFLDADFTMLNAVLAKHYGLSGPRSQRFERVSLKGTRRPGGLLGHASTHLAGSDGADSHPIKRAVWIREHLLHDPPNPPPPDVPALAASVPNFEKLSIREQLVLHREKEACADCHRSIDPWGIALEGYDAIGLLREKTARLKKPVSTETVLPGNHRVSGLADLQKYLLNQRRDQFAKALVSKMLIYALGRSLELGDDPLVEELSVQFAKDDYRLPGLMKNIVMSELFLSR